MSEMKDHCKVGGADVYAFSPLVCVEGRAIIIPLPFLRTQDVRRPHMVVVFYPNKVTEQGFDLAEHRLKVWLDLHEYRPVHFTITPWGRESYLIHGELEDLGNFIREVFRKQDRPLHVRLHDAKRMDSALAPVEYLAPPPYAP